MKKSLEERVSDLEKKIGMLHTGKAIKRTFKIGDTFTLADIEWKILDITEEGYICLGSDYSAGLGEIFSNQSNDWKDSNIRSILAKKLLPVIGSENVVPMLRNIISLDGQDEYGECTDLISIISVDEYRKYRGLIENTDNYWWWTLTPWSTKRNGIEKTCTVVSPGGCIYGRNCNCSIGVRPFCIFSSSIFESGD